MKPAIKRLLPVISFLLIAGFLVTSLTSYYVSRSSVRSEIILNELPLTSDTIYSEIQRDLLRPVLISSLMAHDTFLRDWLLRGEEDPVEIQNYLNEIKTKHNTFTSFLVSDKSRNYYYSDGILKKISTNEIRDVWYFRVREMQDEYEINIDPDLANRDAMTIFINYRVFDYNGNYIGATGVGLTVNAVRKLINTYQEKFDRTVYFIDKTGTVKLCGANFPDNVTNIFTNQDYTGFVENFSPGTECSFKYKRNGELFHTNVRLINEFNWYLVVEQDEGRAIKNIFSTLIANLLICALVTIIVLVLVAHAVSSYQKRIETLRGIVPICCYCKQIRDDKGYWNQVEAYISKYSDAEFSHGICPDCMKKHHPDISHSADDNATS